MAEYDTVTVAEAAALAGVSERWIRKAIERGDLQVFTRSPKRRFLLRKDVEEWERNPKGRPSRGREEGEE